MNRIEQCYPHSVSAWSSEGDTLMDVADFHRRQRAGEYKRDLGNFYPAREGQFTFDHLINPADLSTVPIDATHIFWMI